MERSARKRYCVRMIIDVDRHEVTIGTEKTRVTKQQVQILERLSQTPHKFVSKEELQTVIGARNTAIPQLAISRLQKRLGVKVLTVLIGSGYCIDYAYEPQIKGDVKDMQAHLLMGAVAEAVAEGVEQKGTAVFGRGESLHLSRREDDILQRWANACDKVNDCGKCADEVMCQQLGDKLVGRVIP